MAFTSNSDLFGAVHEDGINRVVRHIMPQASVTFQLRHGHIRTAAGSDVCEDQPASVGDSAQ